MDAVKRYYDAVNSNNPQGMLDECDDAIKVTQSHAKCYFRCRERQCVCWHAEEGTHKHKHKHRHKHKHTYT